MVVDLPRRWRWVIGSGCAIVIGLMVLVLVAEQAVEPDPSVPATARVSAAAISAEITPPAPEPLAVDSASPAHDVDEVEVCGGGWVKLPDVQTSTPEEAERQRADFERATQLPQRRAELLAALHAAPGEMAAATALLVEMSGTEAHIRASLANFADCTAPECRVPASVEAEVTFARDALVQMALATRDPRVYALAFKACGNGVRQEGGCRMVSAEQWARLDPDNAVPWLFVFGNARKPADQTTRDEALHRIATSKRSDAYAFSSASALVEAAPEGDATKLAQAEAVSRMIGIESAVVIPPYQALTATCKADASKDANRAQTCADVAELMTERSSSLLERTIGSAIGRQLGWPADRTDRMRGEYEAYMSSRVGPTGPEASLGCASIDRELERIRQQGRVGDAGELRAWVASSGKKPEDFIREQRARQIVRDAEAARLKRAEAASAAAAAAAGAATASAR